MLRSCKLAAFVAVLAIVAWSAPARAAWPEGWVDVKVWVIHRNDELTAEPLQPPRPNAMGWSVAIVSANDLIAPLRLAVGGGVNLRERIESTLADELASLGLPVASKASFVSSGNAWNALEQRIEQEIKRDRKFDGHVVLVIDPRISNGGGKLHIEASFKAYRAGSTTKRAKARMYWLSAERPCAAISVCAPRWAADDAKVFWFELDRGARGIAGLLQSALASPKPPDAPAVRLDEAGSLGWVVAQDASRRVVRADADAAWFSESLEKLAW